MAAKKAKKAAPTAIETAVERIGDLLSRREDGDDFNWNAEVRKILKKLLKAA
jgi:hypothetical protein